MADPKQLRVLKALTAHLEYINPSNTDPATGQPYAFNLQGRVFRGRSVISAKEAEDALSILEFPKNEIFVPVGDGQVRDEKWQLMLQGWPADDPVNPSDPAYKLKAVVEQRLSRIFAERGSGRGPMYPDEYMLGRELSSFIIVPGVVRPPEDAASRLAMFYMPLVLGVAVDVSDPFK